MCICCIYENVLFLHHSTHTHTQRLFRRSRLSTAIRMRFKGSGPCREQEPFSVEKLTSDFASARSILFAGSVILMLSVAGFSRVNNIEETSPSVELVNGRWVLIPANDNNDDADADAAERAQEKKNALPSTGLLLSSMMSKKKVVPSPPDEEAGGSSFDPNVTSAPSPSNNSSFVLELRSFDGGGDEGRETAIQIDDSGALVRQQGGVPQRQQRKKSRQRSQFELGVF
jgi:hypothetical protein